MIRGTAHFVIQSIKDIPALEEQDKCHGIGDGASTTDGLLAGGTDVEQEPSNQPGTQFVKGLQVERAEGGIQLAAQPELFQTPLRQDNVGRAARLKLTS